MNENSRESKEMQLTKGTAIPEASSSEQLVPDGKTCRGSERVVVTDEDLLDWDVLIEVAPQRPSQSLSVRFVEGGKKPIRISGDPQD